MSIAKYHYGMNLRDLIIIYLACGAPFGVYYFLQNRNLREIKFLWLKSFFRFVFWIPLAFQLVAQKSLFTNLYTNSFVKNTISDAKKEAEFNLAQKYFENVLRESDLKLSIFEFREIFDRYIGLTLEIQNETEGSAAQVKEIFRVTNHKNKKLAEICLHRRNRNRLSFHQNLARRDFFDVLSGLKNASDQPQRLFKEALKLASQLNDSEAYNSIEKLSKVSLQTQETFNVQNLEKELWQSGKHKPSPDNNLISANLQVLTATANLSRKD